MVLCPGYRSVPLKNSYTEDLELAALLIHIEIINAKAGGPGSLGNLVPQFPQLEQRATAPWAVLSTPSASYPCVRAGGR